jgi:O-antigen ligase
VLKTAAPVRGAQIRVLPDSRIGQLVATILFVTLSLGLILPKLAGAGFLLTSLIAIVWLTLNRNWSLEGLSPLERLILAAVIGYVAIWLWGWLINGLSDYGVDGLGRVLRHLLIIPLLLFIRRLDDLEAAWWHGLTIGALLAGGYAWWFFLTGQIGEFEQRVGGPTNPIYFGGVVLAMGLMLIPRIQDPGLATITRMIALIALLMACSASALSGSRGAWLALPVIVVLYLMTLGSFQPLRWRLGLPLALLILGSVVLASPIAPMSERAAAGISDLAALVQGEPAEDTLGRRANMWAIAGEMIAERPLTGSGPGAFHEALLEAIEEGRIDETYQHYRHPHSQYLSALTDAGIPGLLALLILGVLVFRRHLKLWRTGLESTRLLGWTGMVSIVVLATMALTESIFERNTGIIWFSLFTALTIGLVHARRRQELIGSGKTRLHSLSVIIICKNEADRIGRCLDSVAGWADEIVVLDSGSSDETVDIVRRYTDKVEVTDWPGFGPQKQRALDRARGDWVLSLDSDEWLSAELRDEIEVVLSNPEPFHDAYNLPWLNHAFGYVLRFGRWSRAPLRLFKREHGRFTPVAVHEKVELTAGSRVGHLEGPLNHLVFRDLTHACSKLDQYARSMARMRFERGRRVYIPLTPLLRALFNFVDNYFLRAAFLSGRGGLVMAHLYARYTFQKYNYLRRLTYGSNH